MSPDPVALKLAAWKDALIDLSRRNPLLALPTRGVVELREPADELWQLGARRRLRFLGETLPGGAYRHRPPGARDRIVDAATLRTLNQLRLKARLSLNEQGVNTLFIACGALAWFDPSLGATVRSPILLLPVTLERCPDGDGLWLGRFEDEPRVNPTLRYRLARPDLRFELPDPDDGLDAEGFSPTAYADALAQRVAERSGWAVERDACTLGRFSFLNLVMYEELDQRLDALRAHPIVAAIAGDRDAAQALRERETHRYPDVPEPDVEAPQLAFHVLPADPSQERAILAARYGRSLVIQGPPGTGKTQTIANLIAHLIADEKRVLFVSEKMAALEAVFHRLQERGLGDLCLEAHSHKASKHEVLAQLRAALDAVQRAPAVNPSELSVLTTLRDDFHRALEALHRRREPLGLSIYEARGEAAARAAAPDVFFALDQVDETDADAYHRRLQLVERLAAFHDLFARVDSHPWRTVRERRHSQALEVRVRENVADLLGVADALEDGFERLWSALGLPEPAPEATLDRFDALVALVAQLAERPEPPRAWLTDESPDFALLRRDAADNRARFARLRAARAALLERCTPELLPLDHAALLRDLTPADLPADAADRSDAALDAAGQALARSQTDLSRLAASVAPLAELCGVPPPDTLARHRGLLALAASAAADPKPLPAWLERAALDALDARLRDARSRHDERAAGRAALGAIYTEAAYALDLDGLLARFQGEHRRWTRIFSAPYREDRRALEAALLPGVRLKVRPIVEDLKRLISVRDLERGLAQDASGLQASFGSDYRGEGTDWDALARRLAATRALVVAAEDRLPDPLRDRVLAGGRSLDPIRDQSALVEGRLDDAQSALTEVAGHLPLPGAEVRPLVHLPLDALAHDLAAAAGALSALVAARRQVRACHRAPADAAALRSSLNAAAALVDEERAILAESDRLRAAYAPLFDGLATDWDGVLAALDTAQRLRNGFARLGCPPPAVAAEALVRADGIAQELAPHRREQDRALTVWGELFDEPPFATLAAQRAWTEERLGAFAELERWLAFQTLRDTCANAGLLSFCEVALRRNLPPESLSDVFARAFHLRWLDAAAARAPEVGLLSAAAYATPAAHFTRLDRRLIAANAERVRELASARRRLVQGTAFQQGEVGYLQRILHQRRPRASVRKILAEIPNLLFRLKPCLMMSPLSVSLFLDPDRIQFDVVIFDEASQIFPEYALGPLLRAEQAVVAGDSKQLPPTAFFKRLQDGGDGDEDDETAVDEREYESVLDAAAAVLAPDRECYLSWHYRSRHESLIDFSRRQFYESRLATFPSARQTSAVAFEYVEDGVYYGGTGQPRNNPVEAQRVAERVVACIRESPERSVGVIAMSEAQQECVREALARLTRGDDALAAHLDEDRADGFFVKSLEDVQGDERDVIFLSLGYGKWPDGRVRMNFGPLSRSGGGRRLNVAATRARERLVVVSSLLPEEFRLSETTPTGTKLLWEYLRYVRGAAQPSPRRAEAAGDAFVEAVATALEARGHRVERAVGLSHYRIDLAIVDPDDPTRFRLGIECDGANYASGETVRAREWLRGDVLRGLGWKLTRLWSADWVRDPRAALERIEAALVEAPAPAPEPEPTPESAPAEPEPTPEPRPAPAPSPNGLLPGLVRFVPADIPLPGGRVTLYEPEAARERAEFVDALVQREGPISVAAVATRLCRAAGLHRTGGRIQDSANAAVALLEAVGRVEVRDGFVWPVGMAAPPARVPAPGDAPRPVEEICEEEIAEIAYRVLQHGIGMRLEELTVETARILGYGATGSTIRERIERAIARLEYDNRLHNFNGQLRTFDAP